MKKGLLLIAAASLMLSADISVTTGSKKGNYYKYGLRIAKTLGFSSVQKSKGSIENFDRLLSGKAQVAIAQKDAYRWYVDKHPDAEEKIELLGDLKKECIFVVAKKDGKVSSDSDLQKEGIKIAVGKIGSGSKVSWEYMGKLESGFKKATAIPKSGSRALAKVISGDYDAMLTVITPSTSNKLFRQVHDNKDLMFVPIKDWDLNDKYKGQPIYTFENVETEHGFFGDDVDTICTTASVFVSSDMDEDSIDDLADMLLNSKKYILGGK